MKSERPKPLLLFPFLRYVQPTWYFNLVPKKEKVVPYFVDYDKLEERKKQLINFDASYSSHEVSKLDAAFQAWYKGFVVADPENSLKDFEEKYSVSDNYKFIRKYYKSIWSLYILIIRIITLKNPIKEIQGFLENRQTQRVNLYEKIFPHTDNYPVFQSKLIATQPKVSVVIPTLNRYPYLKDAIEDLEKQDYKNFDVIVVDQSEPFQKEFYEQFDLDIKLIHQEEKALWLARNTAIEASDCEWILLFDDDSRVEPDWISQHLKCVDFFDAKISAGVSISAVGDKVPEHYSFFKYSDQFDTGNALIRKDVFNTTGLFDRQFEKQRYGDGEYGLRAYLEGFKNISNPYGQRLHLKVGGGGLRQMGHWDGWRPKKLFAPRPVPSVMYLYLRYFPGKNVFYQILLNIPSMMTPYHRKKSQNTLYKLFLTLLLFPVIIWGVSLSFLRAKKKLRQGPMILKPRNEAKA